MDQVLFLLPVVGLVIAAFVATNLDNLTLLVSWIATDRSSVGRIFCGYLAGMTGLLVISVVLDLVSSVLPVEYLGYLGVVPVALGLTALATQFAGRHKESVTIVSASMMAVASTQMANGVDTVLTFAPLMAESGTTIDGTIAVVFLTTAIAWFGIAWLLGSQASKVDFVTRYGQWIAPVIMIGVGLYIIDNTMTDLMIGSD